ncbi:MAG TPA: glycoside hydrolase family 95 protein, partial [Balneolales bacterium]|nr:glycoside hydrolase family 95 protein [Balneolales bacterium]
MKKRFFLTISLIFLFISGVFAQNNLKIWSTHPASNFNEAYPLGNGRLGAMVYGGVQKNLIQLNDITLWSGGPVHTHVNPKAPEYLPLVRKALFKDEYQKADSLAKKMQGVYSETYLPMGNLIIHQSYEGANYHDYRRTLSLQNAVNTTHFSMDGIGYTRHVFISAPDHVVVIRYTANRRKKLNLNISTNSLLHYHHEVVNNHELALLGKAPAHVDPNYVHFHKKSIIYKDPNSCRGMHFEFSVKAISNDGIIRTDTSGITIKNATNVVLLVSAATSFNGFNKCPDKDGRDEQTIVRRYMKQASAKSYKTLRERHERDFHKYFDRVSLQLSNKGGNQSVRNRPTFEQVKAFAKGTKDPSLIPLYFQYGRYLLISSSRTLDVPADLQGIWSHTLQPPWSSNYTTNINLEMNYWPADETNLFTMHKPLYGFVKNLSITGKTTAWQFYHAKGWVAHHNSDIWALSNPVGDKGHGSPQWANWAMGGNWLCRQLWDHYLFSGNKTFLRDTAYPIMKGAAEFSLDWLIPDGHGHLVTAPSYSPENEFLYDHNKKRAFSSIASTMDMAIIRELFTDLIQASRVLHIDKAFRDTLIAKRGKLYPYHIGHRGNLEEWYKDWRGVNLHHRHVSMLYGLYPGNGISPLRTPKLAKAVKRSLQIRGDAGTGWSVVWKSSLWARLLDGNHAYRLLKDQLTPATSQYKTNGHIYP